MSDRPKIDQKVLRRDLKRAASPFNKKSADIIIRSADGMNFQCHKAVLTLASPVFECMFHPPQSTATGVTDIDSAIGVTDVDTAIGVTDVDTATGLPIVCVTENSTALDGLLRLCYPKQNPVLHRASEVIELLEAAQKYRMGEAIRHLGDALSKYVEKSALQVYAVACRLGMEELARKAAVKLKSQETITQGPEMERMSAGALHRLFQFRNPNVRGPAHCFTFCRPTSIDMLQVVTTTINPVGAEPFIHPSADTIVLSSDGVQFRVYRNILELASPVFADMLRNSGASDGHPEPSTEPPLVRVAEDGRTVHTLLQLCYPMEAPVVEGFDAAHALLSAVKKYGVTSALAWAKRSWVEQMKYDALRACLLAMQMGWEDETEEAIRLLPAKDHQWFPEMESIPASYYFMALERRRNRSKSLSGPSTGSTTENIACTVGLVIVIGLWEAAKLVWHWLVNV
ncbi:uncharacterized protein LAESUDRAFT_682915 [Laetiporus sulphureus 93-53]|uniref:BTB domain-containing protein n=1 Tax=Laetiporus sulphureus 93-53 TaxID=1314785 RepID=A0A165D4J9_9APHY|nr:uncharacterized protein LAESUDRAFT_682915 [Laetiporus sulphureus 93-53]KZT04142.1 hypothetical protein LAESUDRAFT_682915 [Laetiporus sulphureus 93-53]